MNTAYRAYVVGASDGGIFVSVPQLGDGEYGPLEVVKDTAGFSPIYTIGDRVVIGQVGPTPEDFIILGHASRYVRGDGGGGGPEVPGTLPDAGPDGDVLTVVGGEWVSSGDVNTDIESLKTRLSAIFGTADTPEEARVAIGAAATSHTHTKFEVGLGNVDNTSDALKPLSIAMQDALALKANASHSHSASDITSGVMDGNRIDVLSIYSNTTNLRSTPGTNAEGWVFQMGPTYSGGIYNNAWKWRFHSSGVMDVGIVPTVRVQNLDHANGRFFRAHTTDTSTSLGMVLVMDHETGDFYVRRNGVNMFVFNSAGKMTVGTVDSRNIEDAFYMPTNGTANLNDYDATGVYHQSGNSGTSLALNYPEAFAGLLEVHVSGGFVYQRYTIYAAYGARQWTRARYNNSWSVWTLVSKHGRAAGQVNVSNAANAVGSATVSFPSGRFRSAPTAVVTAWTGGPQNVFASNGDPSVSSMSVFVFRTSAATTKVGWIAEEIG